jgi:hypothetical protein
MADKLTFKIEYKGKEHEVTIRPGAYYEFEKQHKDKTLGSALESKEVTANFWLAWYQSLEDGIHADGFEQWIKTLDDIEMVNTGEEHPKDPEAATSDTSSL